MKIVAVVFIILTFFVLFKSERETEREKEEESSKKGELREGEEEREEGGEEGIVAVYTHILKTLRLGHVQQLAVILLVCKIGFIGEYSFSDLQFVCLRSRMKCCFLTIQPLAADSAAALRLIEMGLPEDYMGLFALIDFPLKIIFAIIAGLFPLDSLSQNLFFVFSFTIFDH